MIDHILQMQPTTTIRLGWLPKSAPSAGFEKAQQLAFEAIRTAQPNAAAEPHTIKSQRRQIKAAAVTA